MRGEVRFRRTRVTREEAGIVASPADWSDVAAATQGLPVPQAALLLSFIAQVMGSSFQWRKEATQRSMLSLVVPATVRQAIEERLGTGDSMLTLVEPNQIVAAWRELAFVDETHDAQRLDILEIRARFWEWLMMISEAMERDMQQKLPHPVGLTSDEALAIMAAGSYLATRDFPNALLARTYEMLSLTAMTLSAPKQGSAIDLAESIATAEGFDWRNLLAMACAVIARVDHPDGTMLLDGLEAGEFFPSGFDRGRARRFIDHLSCSLERLRREYEQLDSRHSYPPDWLPLANRPLIHLSDGRYCLSLPNLFIDRLTIGLYYVIWRAWRNATGNPTNRFTDFWGKLLESYVDSLFKAVYPKSPGDRRLWLDQDLEYRGKGGRSDPADVMLDGGDTLVLFEVTSHRITWAARQAAGRGDPSEFKKDLDISVLCKAGQLHRVISDFRGGAFRIGDKDASAFSQFLPVIVTWEAVPPFRPVAEYIQRELADRGILQDRDILPLQVLSLQECEGLLGAVATGESLLDILMQKIRSPEHCYGSFIEFRIKTGKPISAMDHPTLHRAWDELWNKSKILVFGP